MTYEEKNREAIDIANNINLNQLETILYLWIKRINIWDEEKKTLHHFDGSSFPVTTNGGTINLNVTSPRREQRIQEETDAE